MCSDCKNEMGTAFLIKGAIPKHNNQGHWSLVRDHRVARDILKGLLDLVGPAAIVHLLAEISESGLSQNERRELRNSIAEQGRRMGKLA